MKKRKYKYVVFSFDDGLYDFKENALPILNKYNLKVTINIISGFSDETIKTKYKYLNIEDIKELHNNGFEIANHTNSHCRGGSYSELKVCNDKINEWLCTNNVLGVAMPKYVRPNYDAEQYIVDSNTPYVTYSHKEHLYKNLFRRIYLKIINKFHNNDLNLLAYRINTIIYKKGSNLFNRFEISRTINPFVLFKSLEHIKNSKCITLCFHSITDDYINCDYPKGSYSVKDFEKLCKLIYSDYRFKVITQLEASSKGQQHEE